MKYLTGSRFTIEKGGQVAYERFKGHFTVSTDPARLDIDVIHRFLTQAYWSRGIPRERVERAIAHSLCFGLYEDEKQIGFARVATDYARFANIMDVFVLEEYRGRGLGKWLMECVMEQLTSFGLYKIMLNTSSAHWLYRRFGFSEVKTPENCMEIYFQTSYSKKE